MLYMVNPYASYMNGLSNFKLKLRLYFLYLFTSSRVNHRPSESAQAVWHACGVHVDTYHRIEFLCAQSITSFVVMLSKWWWTTRIHRHHPLLSYGGRIPSITYSLRSISRYSDQQQTIYTRINRIIFCFFLVNK